MTPEQITGFAVLMPQGAAVHTAAVAEQLAEGLFPGDA
jgi:hypothetical protein